MTRMKFFWINLLAMVVVIVVAVFAVLKWLDSYTMHGEAIVVPNVKGMLVHEADRVFHAKGLNGVVSDSTYVKEQPSGCILDYHPALGQKVKKGRTIYLTINTLSTPLQVVPHVADNSSVRQAQARLLASGFALTVHDYVPGEKDWVYEVTYKGRALHSGDKVPMGSTLTLVVGDGGELPLEGDSLDVDVSVPAPTQESSADDSWF